MLKQLLMLITAAALTTSAAAWAAPAADQDELLKKIDALEKQLQELKAMKQASLEKKGQCLSAVGAEKYCACLAEKLPREIGFEQYIHTAITTKEKLGYDSLTPEQKKLTDTILAARDACVEKAKGGLFW